jgi:hypothetical protein
LSISLFLGERPEKVRRVQKKIDEGLGVVLGRLGYFCRLGSFVPGTVPGGFSGSIQILDLRGCLDIEFSSSLL